MKSRTVASTQMNADSSRSHSVFVITVRQKDMNDESKNIFAKGELTSSMFANSTLFFYHNRYNPYCSYQLL